MAEEKKMGDIKSISYFVPVHWLLHGYVWPFFIIYACLAASIAWIDWEDYFPILLGSSIVASLHSLTALFCVWSVPFRAMLTCRKVSRLRGKRCLPH